MSKIRMEIKLSNGKDEHVLKFDEGDLKIMIAALYDWYSADGEEEYISDEMSGDLNYFYDCLKDDDDDYDRLYDRGDCDE